MKRDGDPEKRGEISPKNPGRQAAASTILNREIMITSHWRPSSSIWMWCPVMVRSKLCPFEILNMIH